MISKQYYVHKQAVYFVDWMLKETDGMGWKFSIQDG